MKRIFLFLLTCCSSLLLHATHNRAGEITYEQIGPLTIKVTVTTYTKASSTAADRDSLEVFWGDGIKSWVKRANGSGQILDNDVKLNYYISEHTYPGRSSYTISFLDPNRSGNIVNINYPRSEDVTFYLATRFTLLDVQFQGYNSSVRLLQPPVDIACVGQPFIHNPNAFDPDGDSISYELITPLQAENSNVPNYIFPDKIVPGTNNQIFLDPVTGDFTWKNPPQAGEYNIAMRINEWRGGIVINSVIRDMQIFVRACNNRPPILDLKEEYCVVAGQEINIPIKASDPDLNQKIKVTLTGGPFTFDNDKPLVTGPSNFAAGPYTINIKWKTTCNHIAKDYYQIIVRALDNAFGDTFGLATLKAVRIKVVGPPPELVKADVQNKTQIKVSWKNPYDCETTIKDYFYGFSVWRKEQAHAILQDTCQPDNLRSSYTRIVFNTKQKNDSEYFIIDKDVMPYKTYCYRILGEFAFKTQSGNPYNRITSLPSEEVCIQLKRDIPLLTKVSVNTTSSNQGSIDLRWAKPLPTDFDTILFNPPYKTELYRREAGSADYSFVDGSTKIAQRFATWRDTVFTDQNLNTLDKRYDYKLKFYYASNIEYQDSPSATSVFITISPSDMKNTINMHYATPWTNQQFIVYRKNDLGTFEIIGRSTKPIFEDLGLKNKTNYCYKVQAIGTYGFAHVENPLLNFSQEACGFPEDNQGPCTPILTVESICDEDFKPGIEIANKLNIVSESCINNGPASSFKIYFRNTKNKDFILLDQVTGSTTTYFHNTSQTSIAGCYKVKGIDEVGNESQWSDEICVENCPVYELPNTFTPNADGSNEVFKPIKNFFIASVDFTLYNEWGNKIFETNDPSILWEGKTTKGDNYPTGTYYYVCNVYVEDPTGLKVDKKLKGYINLLR